MKILSGVLLLLFSTIDLTAQSPPHIVLFFVDDLGWADLEHRNEKLHTPHIDQLRREGLEFTRAYIATPTCSPSRASLLTGKEPVRFQMSRHISGGPEAAFNYWETDPVQRPSRNWLPLEEITYAEILKQAGYYNQFIGKWHLGHEPYYPQYQGFDATFGVTDHGHPKSYYSPFFTTGNPFPETHSESYLTDVLTDAAADFIQTYEQPQPFMLSFWYYNVHGPHEGRRDWVEQYEREGLSGKYAQYAAMVSTMDESIGRIRQALQEKGIADNTVILFLSDQGGFFENAPLSGGKRGGNTLGEGGARVPMIIRYPGVTTAGSTCHTPVKSLDVFPTLAEIATGKRYKNRAIQGQSLLPLLAGKTMKKRELYFFRSYEDQYAAVMSGDWKLIKYHSGEYRLFYVGDDISEANNLVGKGLPQERRLKRRLAKWEAKAVPAIPADRP